MHFTTTGTSKAPWENLLPYLHSSFTDLLFPGFLSNLKGAIAPPRRRAPSGTWPRRTEYKRKRSEDHWRKNKQSQHGLGAVLNTV